MLRHAGFDDVAVYEATPATVAQSGGVISLEHAALDVLDRLGVGQDEFVACDSEQVWHTSHAHAVPSTIGWVYPGRLTTWTLLHRVLTRRLPAGTVHTGHRVTGLDTHRGRPRLRFAGGASTAADLVVFADGRASAGRRLLDPGRALRYAGYVAHRGEAPDRWAGLPDFVRVEPCPGVQLNIAPIPGGADWTFYLNATPAEYTACFGAPPSRRLFALPHHVTPAARAHVDAHAERHLSTAQARMVHDTGTRMAVPVMDIDPPTRMVWPVGTGYAILLGDALAPVRPHTARGLNNGIEQAAGLVAALAQHRKYAADLPAALDGWQHRQLPAAVAAVRLGPVLGAHAGLGATVTTVGGVR
jgi:2,6-dihydroxypyridine 3-monooxygenase